MGAHVLGESLTVTRFYELGLTPGVKVADRTFFRPGSCGSCGRYLAEQVIDLALLTEPEVVDLPWILVAPGGHLVVRSEVLDELGRQGLVASVRPAAVGDSPPGVWFHIEPRTAVSLARWSLREEPQMCGSCGGRARPSFDGRWVIEADKEVGVLAYVRGASQIKIASSDVADMLGRLAPGVELRPLPDGEDVGEPEDPQGWRDL